MICPNCKRYIDDDSTFCPYCEYNFETGKNEYEGSEYGILALIKNIVREFISSKDKKSYLLDLPEHPFILFIIICLAIFAYIIKSIKFLIDICVERSPKLKKILKTSLSSFTNFAEKTCDNVGSTYISMKHQTFVYTKIYIILLIISHHYLIENLSNIYYFSSLDDTTATKHLYFLYILLLIIVIFADLIKQSNRNDL